MTPDRDTASLQEIVHIFNEDFGEVNQFILRGGAEEPCYLPGMPSVIWFRRDYVRSALHEIAHWFIAGSSLREILDYRYWYVPEERTQEVQRAFFLVERERQALETIFCDAIGIDFEVSLDNLCYPLSTATVRCFQRAVDDLKQDRESSLLTVDSGLFWISLKNICKVSIGK